MDPASPNERQRPREAAPGSLRHALISNNDKYLWVDPIAWYSEHLRLLDCPPPIIVLPPPAAPRSETPYSGDALRFHSALKVQEHARNNSLTEVIRELLKRKRTEVGMENLWLRKNMGLDLYYGDRKVAVLRARCTAIETSSLRPVLTYVDQSALENKRENFFRARKLLRLQRDYRKGREPAAEIDPYLVAIMIAMARAASESYRKKGIEKPSFQVHLITSAKDTKSLIRYSSHISAIYLKKFSKPYRYFDSSLIITQTKISIDTLDEIASAIDDIFRDNLEILSPITPRKRKALADVSNQFDESPPMVDADEHKSKRHLDENEMQSIDSEGDTNMG